jgi:hypothetical protein
MTFYFIIMKNKIYRKLTDKEIATLTVYGCSAENWNNVTVDPEFKPDFISSVHFSGTIRLGKFEKTFESEGGLKKHAGITQAILHNVTVGNDVYINRINNHIANYQIDDESFIENVNCLATTGISAFGNGTSVATMIESGERSIRIFNGLSAPLAYILTFYRHKQGLQDTYNNLLDNYIRTIESDKALIGKGCIIINTDSVRNVFMGDYTRIQGASIIENGSINSNAEAPVFIGNNVIAKDFIIESGSVIDSGSMIHRCFIGQACSIEKQFSATDSLFFANCQGHHGEAASIFAGPYTVTHHKSTLMLTALYSFMNAGSGTNFSNHMYKLGPIHQGITERGVKTSSGSYIMWPAKIGAYSVVLGKHKNNPDISSLPFSYLIENEGESVLLPGINLQSAGTYRDVQKWPVRDNRKGTKTDPVIFDMLNPALITKLISGIEILEKLLIQINPDTGYVWYENCKIKKSSLKKGIELYQSALDIFMYESVSAYEQNPLNTDIDIENWADLAGLVAPLSVIDNIISRTIQGQLNLKEIQENLQQIIVDYPAMKYAYANQLIEKKYNKEFSQLDISEKKLLFENWQKATLALLNSILRDARKEFSLVAKTGFGIDGDEQVKQSDFTEVRGEFENHDFVIKLKNKIYEVENKTFTP